MSREQFAYRKEHVVYRVGLIRSDGQFIEIATVPMQSWANRITLALNNYDPDPEAEKMEAVPA